MRITRHCMDRVSSVAEISLPLSLPRNLLCPHVESRKRRCPEKLQFCTDLKKSGSMHLVKRCHRPRRPCRSRTLSCKPSSLPGRRGADAVLPVALSLFFTSPCRYSSKFIWVGATSGGSLRGLSLILVPDVNLIHATPGSRPQVSSRLEGFWTGVHNEKGIQACVSFSFKGYRSPTRHLAHFGCLPKTMNRRARYYHARVSPSKI